MHLKGMPICKGIGLANVLKVETLALDTTMRKITDPGQEIALFRAAVDKTIRQLEAVIDICRQRFTVETTRIFEAHQLIAGDPEAKKAIETVIKEEKVNAAHAVKVVIDRYINTFQDMEDLYFRERAADVRSVSRRLIKNILGVPVIDYTAIRTPVIIVAEDLAPYEIAQVDPAYVKGIATEQGGKTSHSAIIARLMEIPAVFGINGLMRTAKPDQDVIIDGLAGDIIFDADPELKHDYEDKRVRFEQEKTALLSVKGEATISKDGGRFALHANIASPYDLGHVHEHDAEGIGLFRTEFLFLNRTTLPSEDEQYEAYKAVLESMDGKPVVIRTIDIGGDKDIPHLNIALEQNPFLGNRAIRRYGDDPILFKTQLRALLKASIHGNLSIMFPMVATRDEFVQARQWLDTVRQELVDEGVTVSKNIPVGLMIEVPSSALAAASLAKEADFFSIGTNDLIQYTMAADRTSQKLSYLYQPLHPSVLKLIKMVADAANKQGIPVAVCGEAASDEWAGPVMLAFGVRSLSMIPTSILAMRKRLAEMDLSLIKTQQNRLLEAGSETEVKTLLETFYR